MDIMGSYTLELEDVKQGCPNFRVSSASRNLTVSTGSVLTHIAVGRSWKNIWFNVGLGDIT